MVLSANYFLASRLYNDKIQRAKREFLMPVNPPVIYQQANERVWSYARPPDCKGQSNDLLL